MVNTIGVINNNNLKSYEAYTLGSPMACHTTFLVDNNGNLKKQWLGTKPCMKTLLIEEGVRKGQLLRLNNSVSDIPTNLTYGGAAGIIELRSWNDDLIWSYKCAGKYNITDNIGTVERDEVIHHDFAYNLENDSVFLLSWVAYTAEESINYFNRNPSLINYNGINNGGIVCERIVEIPIGNGIQENVSPIWEWNMSNYFTTNKNEIEKIYINYYKAGDKEDIFHANSLDYNSEYKELMMSVRGYHELIVINYDSKNIVYRWGNPTVYLNDYLENTSSEYRILDGQHCCNWINNGEYNNKIIIFDNDQYAQTNSESRIIFPIRKEDGTYEKNTDGIYLPVAPELSMKLPNNYGSWFISGSQKLPNNNYLCNAGPYGTLLEYNQAGDLVWKYVYPFKNAPGQHSQIVEQGSIINYRDNMVFRALKYSIFLPIFQNSDFLNLGKLENYKTFPNTIGDYLDKNNQSFYNLLRFGGYENLLLNPNANCVKIPNISVNLNNTINFSFFDIQLNYNLSQMNNNKYLPYLKSISKDYVYQDIENIDNENLINSCINGKVYSSIESIDNLDFNFGTIYRDDSKISSDYLLINTIHSSSTYLIDSKDNVLETWYGHDMLNDNGEIDNGYGNNGPPYLWDIEQKLLLIMISKRVDDPNMGVPFSRNAPEFLGGKKTSIFIKNTSGNILWRYDIPEFNRLYAHHDIFVDEIDGDKVIFVLMNKKLTPEEWYALGALTDTWRIDNISEQGINLPYIRVIKPNLLDGTTQVIWEYDYLDNIIQTYNPNLSNYKNVNDASYKITYINSLIHGRYNGDPFHVNTVSYNNIRKEIVLSFRITSEIVIIDYNTKQVVFKYCGAPSFQNTFNNSNNARFLGQHDIHWINYGSETNALLLYNNGNGIYINGATDKMDASIIILKVLFNGKYNYNKAEILFEYKFDNPEINFIYNRDYLSDFRGGVRLASNGNFIITHSEYGYIIEVTNNKEIVKQYINPMFGNNIKTLSTVSQDLISKNSIFKTTVYSSEQFTNINFTHNYNINSQSTNNDDTNDDIGY